MGGMYAYKAAGLGHFRRVVPFYGMIRVPPAWAGPGHGEPLDALHRLHASPVLAIIGELDPYTPPADVLDLEKTRARVVRYPEAEHGFVHDPNRPAHRPADAADAWARCFAFLDT
jgi:carboxymethylenebutenolidase